MKFLSLFAGIGGFDLGLERAGMKCVGQVEINKFCQKVLEKHWPDVKRIGDIHDVRGDEFGAADLVCGGVPCQPASCAGQRKGTGDDRWLWPEAFRIVRAVKPDWCLFENVRGLLTLEDGVVFENLLLELEGIGYETLPLIIPACAVGAPHRRDRVWIVANSTESGLSESRLAGIGKFSTETGTRLYDRPEQQDSHAADTESGKSGEQTESEGWKDISRTDSHASDTDSQGLQGSKREQSIRLSGQSDRGWCNEKPNWQENWLEVAQRLCRVDDGVSNRVDRLKALGNAVVPQIVEIIGRSILKGMI